MIQGMDHVIHHVIRVGHSVGGHVIQGMDHVIHVGCSVGGHVIQGMDHVIRVGL